ncbi:hypothetical protein [Falsiroseomonas sp.]|uniref:hypothetical protein n=1 Tax=Falsiroseomonas sp. TaxID=2870721 RepID=UPI002736B2E6|nr:hypothetical protein [Falsiroseomonas sp.]MDP3418060.1 hypothetical protein [Falsiroseomonas sp.]
MEPGGSHAHGQERKPRDRHEKPPGPRPLRRRLRTLIRAGQQRDDLGGDIGPRGGGGRCRRWRRLRHRVGQRRGRIRYQGLPQLGQPAHPLPIARLRNRWFPGKGMIERQQQAPHVALVQGQVDDRQAARAEGSEPDGPQPRAKSLDRRGGGARFKVE